MISEVVVGSTVLSSLFGRWETRFKLPGLTMLVFSFALVQDLRILPLMFLSAMIIYRFSALPFAYFVSRLRLPGFFLVAMAVILPFWSGQTVLWQCGPLALRLEGCLSLLLVAAKFTAILMVVVVLFATTPLSLLTRTMRAFGIPWLMTDLLLFTYRYLFQLSGDLKRTHAAACLRGFQGKSLFSLKTFANITGSLLVRSNKQAERVFQAMTLRGYGNGDQPLSDFRPAAADYLLLAVVLLLAAAIILSQAFL